MKIKDFLILPVAFIFIAALTRLVPHYPNFTAVGAMALFSAAYLRPRILSLMIPFVALFVSDLILNNLVYRPFMTEQTGFIWFRTGSLWIYGGFALIVLLGLLLFRKVGFKKVIAGSLLASITFFLVSNFGVWMTSALYPKTWAGLLTCFEAAIPFFWNTLFGDLFYVGVLFGGYALVSHWMKKRKLATYSSSADA